MVFPAKKKLLVLDVNGFLLDTYFNSEKRPDRPADGKVNSHFVYRRPYCNEFLEFCFENFELGIWSSARRHNVDKFVDFIFGDLKSKLLFSWHQTECTDTGLKTPGNRYKPVFLKELSNLWNKVQPDLPWEKGDYGPFNTLLIDDSPYKALRNPPHTAVFPYPYKVTNDPDDILGGALHKYLEGLAIASDVQHYVKHHPFGQPPVIKGSPNWYFYSRLLLPMADQNTTWAPSCQEYELQSKSLEDREVGSESGNGQHSKSGPHIAKQKKKRKHLEENHVVESAMPNMEKSVSLEDREVGLQHVKEHSESGSHVGKQKKKQRVHLATSSNQYPAPRMEKEENGVVEAPRANMDKRNGITQASLSQKHESPNLFRGDKDANLLSDHRESLALGLVQKKKHKFQQASSVSQEFLDMGSKDDGLAKMVKSCTARGDTPMVSFSQEQEARNSLCEEKEMDAQTDEDCCHNNISTKSGRKLCDQNNFRHVNNGHRYKSSNFRKDYPNHQSSRHLQRNRYGGNRASYFPGRWFQENQGHRNGVNTSLQTEVAHRGVYANNNMYCGNTVHANLPLYQWGGYINDDKVLWPTHQSRMWGGFQHEPHGQSYNSSLLRSRVLQGQSYKPIQGTTEVQGPGDQWNDKRVLRIKAMASSFSIGRTDAVATMTGILDAGKGREESYFVYCNNDKTEPTSSFNIRLTAPTSRSKHF